jgi:Zn finger protein HypA/HybF involved in hydrogenase expression
MTDAPMTSGTHEEFPCQQCGAKLEFAPGTTGLQCPYCGHTQTIATATSQAKAVEERSFAEALRNLRQQPVSALAQGAHEIQCNGCGAVTQLTAQAAACPFCASPVVIPVEQDRATIVPESVLPFHVDERKAGETFKTWVTSRWFAPNDLAAKARRARMDGVYLPYFTFDAETGTRYTGQRGEHYYVTETYKDAQGNTQTRQVQKTRWYPASGHVDVNFDDLLICASKSLPEKLINDLEPWDLQALTPYDPRYLSGFMAERPAIDLQQGFDAAKQKMVPAIESAIRSDIGGDVQQISSYSTNHSNVTFKLFFLPLWLSSFRYDDKVYRFVVNARTGEATGERPYSVIKIVLAVLAGLIVVAGIIWAVQMSQAQ